MRCEVVFDLETTGLNPELDRIIEIGAIKLVDFQRVGKPFHVYLNPERRRVNPEAFKIHGLSNNFLRYKPKFKEVVDDFLAYIGDAKLVAHNASFDIKFLNFELRRLGYDHFPSDKVIDTLQMARKIFPQKQNTLDALCKRFKIDNSRRTLHGALLDSEILSEVYIELSGGKQRGFAFLEEEGAPKEKPRSYDISSLEFFNESLLTSEELKAHQDLCAAYPHLNWNKVK